MMVVKNRQPVDINGLISGVKTYFSNDFNPNPSDIKKAIDIMIDKEYIGCRVDKKYVYLPHTHDF